LVLCVAFSGLGFVAGRALRPAAPPLVIERRTHDYSASGQQTAASANATSVNAANVNAATVNSGATVYGADGTETERPTEATELVSICGARTKRGTPCSRRVRGTGRCWQHRGKPAMLSASKLIVRE
jgi:hypothetical protein